jgi:hypothetical protein
VRKERKEPVTESPAIKKKGKKEKRTCERKRTKERKKKEKEEKRKKASKQQSKKRKTNKESAIPVPAHCGQSHLSVNSLTNAIGRQAT